MESGNLEFWKNYLNKRVKLILDDGGIHPMKKEGILVSITETHLILQINSHQEAILLSRIIRGEL